MSGWPLRLAFLGLLLVLGCVVLGQVLERVGIAPRLLGEYLERRASGHAPWIESIGHTTNRVLQALDRGDSLRHPALPDWAGARVTPPAAASASARTVISPEQLRAAMAAARPGDVFVLRPGLYRFAGASLETSTGGTEARPITVRGETFGSVTLEFDLLEGFVVSAPFWRFENLVVRGVCTTHANCEHAFHVVGSGHHVVIRNNLVSDFNAHVKINGLNGRFPDNGRILQNTLVNSAPRHTDTPVAPIDLVAASNWSIEANLIADFAHAGGDLGSSGAFAKGGGHGNQFVRNVVICELRQRGFPGRRVGLSFGDGGSDPSGCRDRKCVVEHEDGLMADNLIASCSDEGIYINRSARTRLDHNTVVDTAGIYIRYPESSAKATANLVDGAIRAREGALLDVENNETTSLWSLYLGWHPVRAAFLDAEALDFRFRSQPMRVKNSRSAPDLCGATRPDPASVGAFEDFAICQRDRVVAGAD